MVLENVKEKLERFKAKRHGMTVPELREHMRQRKEERKRFKLELKEKERAEHQKFEEWKIEQKYKQKRKQVKKGGGGSITDVIYTLGGRPSEERGSDPLGLFGSPKRSTRKRKPSRRKR